MYYVARNSILSYAVWRNHMFCADYLYKQPIANKQEWLETISWFWKHKT